eukprot:TRINITY_DN67399_c6_g2_i1.p1 TRINITY_DN67399_c6_g2~~TRINITY_DN67399_c6_g2_i1.p1  ORF type:complete len:324 (+),score=41.68 TRINITY_DN67399_c6_g2_i1:38-1009(+)
MACNIHIKLDDNPMGVYAVGDKITGHVIIQCPKGAVTHSGISIELEGKVALQLPTKSLGVFETLYNELKPLQLCQDSFTLTPSGKLPEGTSTFQFSFTLQRSAKGPPLFETYHGVFINVQYFLHVNLQRGKFQKNQREQVQLLVQNPGQTIEGEDNSAKPHTFTMTPKTHQVDGRKGSGSPNFTITGRLDTKTCSISDPFIGFVTVQQSDATIKSVELHLCRVETCSSQDKTAKETTYIQNTQVAMGDPCRNMPIPIFLVFPRLLTCPTLDTFYFKAEFQVNVVVVFEDDSVVEEQVPLRIFRQGPAKLPPQCADVQLSPNLG